MGKIKGSGQSSKMIETEGSHWEQFGKGESIELVNTPNCVIYTRVSSKEQEEGYSLDIQLKSTEDYAKRESMNVLGYFGGRYESAQSDVERKEFNRMLAFLKKSKEKISYILVYSVDRFSRTGANAIYIAEQFRLQNIQIIAIIQPSDTSTPTGRLQQNIQFIFSQYENDLRREKCVAGVVEALKKGEWCHKPPLGYDILFKEGERKIIVNDKGKLLRKAFMWKAETGISNEDARNRLSKLGLKVSHQHISRIFKNSFYCGLMAHNALEGKLIEGNHEKLITKEIFLKVNNIQNQNAHGYGVTIENDNLPLKGLLKCEDCNSNLTGYIVKKKGIYYYKCRTKGCCNNHSAKQLNTAFEKMLQYFVIDGNCRG